jgi:arabinogalactan oligomer/maltooligosaccharide transport system permease protein
MKMKNKIRILILIFIVAFLLTGCKKQIELKEECPNDNNNYILNKLTDYEYEDEGKPLKLKLQSVEIKVDNSFKGKTAIIYKKDFNDELIRQEINELFLEEEKDKFNIKLIKSLENIISILKNIGEMLSDNFSSEEKEEFNVVINEYELLLLKVISSNDYGIEELLNELNKNKELIERFILKRVNNDVKAQEKATNTLRDYVDTLLLLNRAYKKAINTLPNYSDSKDYVTFSNKVISYFKDDVSRHKNIESYYSKLINWAEEEVVNNSNQTIDYLYIIKENNKADVIEKNIKSNIKEFRRLNDINTYKQVSEIINNLLIEYEKKYEEEIDSSKDLKYIKKTLEDVKSVNVQKNITLLNKIKGKLKKQIENKYVLEAMNKVSNDLKDIINEDNTLIKYDFVDQNENEIFVCFKFNKLNDVCNIYVNTIKNTFGGEKINENIIVDLIKIKGKYIIEQRKSTELLLVRKLLEEINYETESLKVIKLDLESTKTKNNFIKSLKLIEKQYTTKTKKIYEEFISTLNMFNNEEIISNEQIFYEEVISDLDSLNSEYKKIINNQVEKFSNEFSNKSSSNDSKKVLDMIEEDNIKAKKQINNNRTLQEITNEFNKYYTAYFYFNEPLQYNIRIGIEGKVINKLNVLGKIDIKDTYLINGKPSGEKAIRIKPESKNALFIFNIKSFGLRQWKILLIVLLTLLIAIKFINKKVFKKILLAILLLFIAFIVLYPVIWIIGSSFNKSQSLLSAGISPIPKELSLLQYERLFKTTKYANWYFNTFKIASINMILSVLLTVSTAYIFSRFKFKGKKTSLISILILQMFPSFLGMVAIYILLSRITFLSTFTGTKSLINTHLGLILVYACGQIPYNTWLVKGYFDTIPRSLDDAAKIDGASNIKAFWKIILPLGRPIISFVAITNFMAPWMDFIFPRLIITSPEKRTLAVGLYEMIKGHSDNAFTMFAAGAVLVAVPITILFSCFQKYIVTGLSSGAVKG